MQILMIVLNRVGKGSYWRAFFPSQVLASRGHNVTLMAMSPYSRLRGHERVENGVRLIETPDLLWGSLRSGWDPWDTLWRMAWVRNRQFDIVHAVESRPIVLFPALLAQRQGAKLVMDWADLFGRGGSVEERPNVLVRAILRPIETYFENRFRLQADGTIAISKFLYQRVLNLGVSPDRVLHLPNGADVENIYPIPKDEARRMLGWPRDIPVIGYIGAIFKRDADLMMRAFHLLREACPDARLLLLGYFNLPTEKQFTDPNAILRTGTISREEIRLYLAACDVCWLPMCNSLANQAREPLKMKDYMCAGRPVIATNVGDAAELVREGRFGLLATDSPQDVADKTIRLLRDPALCEIMGQNGRHLVESRYTWEHFTDRLEQFYSHILRE